MSSSLLHNIAEATRFQATSVLLQLLHVLNGSKSRTEAIPIGNSFVVSRLIWCGELALSGRHEVRVCWSDEDTLTTEDYYVKNVRRQRILSNYQKCIISFLLYNCRATNISLLECLIVLQLMEFESSALRKS